jgi:hypothetical protein
MLLCCRRRGTKRFETALDLLDCLNDMFPLAVDSALTTGGVTGYALRDSKSLSRSPRAGHV